MADIMDATKALQDEIFAVLQKPEYGDLPTFAVLGVLTFTQALVSSSAMLDE